MAPNSSNFPNEYGRFRRVSANPKKVSPQWLEKFKAGGVEKAELFAEFLRANENVGAVETKMRVKKLSKVEAEKGRGWLDREGLLELHKQNEKVVDAIIAAKTAAGAFRPHPDCPHLKEKTLYHVLLHMSGAHCLHGQAIKSTISLQVSQPFFCRQTCFKM